MISSIIEAFKIGLDICFFKKSAADMPYRSQNHTPLGIFAFFYLLISLVLQIKFLQALPLILQTIPDAEVQLTLGELPSTAVLFLSELMQLGIFGGLFFAIINSQKFAPRFPQAFLAFIVTNTILAILLTAVIGPHIHFTVTQSPLGLITLLLLVGLSTLNITTATRIIRDTLETSSGKAFLSLIALSFGSKLLASFVIGGLL